MLLKGVLIFVAKGNVVCTERQSWRQRQKSAPNSNTLDRISYGFVNLFGQVEIVLFLQAPFLERPVNNRSFFNL